MAAKLSSSGGGRYQETQNAEINVTPFVDVMLVLLIIFMVAAPMAAVTVKVALPPAVAPPGTNPPKPIYISIQPNGGLFIQDFRTDLPSLGDDLAHPTGRGSEPDEGAHLYPCGQGRALRRLHGRDEHAAGQRVLQRGSRR